MDVRVEDIAEALKSSLKRLGLQKVDISEEKTLINFPYQSYSIGIFFGDASIDREHIYNIVFILDYTSKYDLDYTVDNCIYDQDLSKLKYLIERKFDWVPLTCNLTTKLDFTLHTRHSMNLETLSLDDKLKVDNSVKFAIKLNLAPLVEAADILVQQLEMYYNDYIESEEV